MAENANILIEEALSLTSPKSFFLFAGAGSGKTGSLVNSLKKFKKEQGQAIRHSGKQVAIITYTKAARDEIIRRLEYDSIFKVSTIHSFCWDLISPYQVDIKEWIKQEIQNNIVERVDKIENPGTRKPEKYKLEKQYLEERLDNLESIRKITYSPDGLNEGKHSLNHAEVIKMAGDFIANKPLLQSILIAKFPIILIDESQDTKHELIEALFALEEKKRGQFSLGLFGDTMQRIYNDGKVDLGENLPESWLKPVKTINYRCPRRVIKLINAIRGDQAQSPGPDNIEGHVRIFLIRNDEGFDKTQKESEIASKMADLTGDDGWNSEEKIKILTLEHRMAARRGDFFNFFDPLYTFSKEATGLLDGTQKGIPFLTQVLYPLLVAIKGNDEFEIARIVRKNSPLLKPAKLKGQTEPVQQITFAREAIQSLSSQIADGANPQIIVLLRSINESGLFEIPVVLQPYCKLPEEENASAPESKNATEELIDGWEVALKAPYRELEGYAKYIADESRFGTHQGVKGLEFERVMVILDDNEAKGFLFSYEKLFGVLELSKRDLKNYKEGKETSIERTKRLFYVTCSRAKKSLAIVAYTQSPSKVSEFLIREGWFNEDEVIE